MASRRGGGSRPAEGGAGVAIASGGPCRPGNRLPKPNVASAKSTIPKRGPPPAAPKKLDYKKPTMTKAMAQRLKHTQKLQEEMERKERERVAAQCRRPQRTAAPMGGDARMGKERRPRTATSQAGVRSRPGSSKEPQAPPPCPPAEPTAGPSCPRKAATPCPARGRSPPASGVSTHTRNLAKSMNADIVQAELLERGAVDSVIIPPGTINAEKTTIVSIPQPDPGPSHLPSSTLASAGGNRSAQMVAEVLDEQEAAETAVVNSKLQDLQAARRDFVMAVANVGGSAINLQDEEFPNINVTPIDDITPPMMMSAESPTHRYGLQRCPSLEDPCLQVEYGRQHPVVEAAREYLRTRQTERRFDEDFARIACQPAADDDLDQEYLDGCGLVPVDGDDEDDEICMPAEQYCAIPRRGQTYRHNPLEIDQLEKFFDLQNYPPPPPSPPPPPPTGPPPGRENLHPDLWELDDPWYKEPSCPDLIDWRSF